MGTERAGWVTRFAPSPTGELHLGHAFAAFIAWSEARASGGKFLLRWEDIDAERCRREYEGRMLEDLCWLGLDPDGEPLRQSERKEAYGEALDRLESLDLLFPCFCSRREIREEWKRMASAPHEGEIVYPGACSRLRPEEARRRMETGQAWAMRLRSGRAEAAAGRPVWTDRERGSRVASLSSFGDLVLGRKGIGTSFHLAVTLDDALQGVTLVTRGDDLYETSAVHRVLQRLLGLPEPLWRHHALVRDSQGRRLAKRDQSLSLRELRRRAVSSAEVLDLMAAMAQASAGGRRDSGWEIGGTVFRLR